MADKQDMTLAEAVQFLELDKEASIKEITERYKSLLFQWHPDHCREEPEQCRHMTEKTIQAYDLVMSYCHTFKIPLSPEDLEKKDVLEDEEAFWHRHFGGDALWGYRK